MKLYNLNFPSEIVSFSTALKTPLGKKKGLFFPTLIPTLDNVRDLLKLDFVTRSKSILGAWLAKELGQSKVNDFVDNAFTFPLPLVSVNKNCFSMELFHGPTLAFKDFGARFMAQSLSYLSDQEKITILTATSGDTGAAVADAFYAVQGVQVIVLYPKDKISPLQEKLFSTKGKNIHSLAINADFDACQQLVKQAFADKEIQQRLSLNSANSINISRLLAQICYYFEAVAKFTLLHQEQPVIAVPSGNFGNLTAGLLAKAMGAPIKRFIAATNSNDTVPRYLADGHWQTRPTRETMSSAMDVSQPNNWPRVEAIIAYMKWSLFDIAGVSISERQTQQGIKSLYQSGYVSEPHSVTAFQALKQQLAKDEKGIFLSTAHPSKFQTVVESIIESSISLPDALAQVVSKRSLSLSLENDFDELKNYLLSLA